MTLPHPKRIKRDSYIRFRRSRPVSISVSHPEAGFTKRGITIPKFCDIVNINAATIYTMMDQATNCRIEIEGYIIEWEYEDTFRANLEACGLVTFEKRIGIYGAFNVGSNRKPDKDFREAIEKVVNNAI